MTSLIRSSGQLCRLCNLSLSQPIRNNCNRASVCRINRNVYARMYPTILVFPDGSTIHVRHKEPRRIIKMPLDEKTLSEEDRLARQRKHKPKIQLKTDDDIEDSFDINNYSHLWKK